MNTILTENSKIILLLCADFNKNDIKEKLTTKEYSALAQWLMSEKLSPQSLFDKEVLKDASLNTNLDLSRLEFLLKRGSQLAFALENWTNQGIFLITRSDKEYPVRFKQHFKDKAPPFLYAMGNKNLLQGGGLGIVGSRNIDNHAQNFTQEVARKCVENSLNIISGGARGVDQISMDTALENGGNVIGILAENLLKKSLMSNMRQALADKNLLLLSLVHPEQHFTVINAMNRNKFIYAMSDYTLVVNTDFKKGGTWAGASEELKRKDSQRPVFVRIDENSPEANSELLKLGARAVKQENLLTELQNIHNQISTEKKEEKEKISVSIENKDKQEISLYSLVLPILLNHLNEERNIEELIDILDINKGQLSSWLKKAVEENKIKKLSNPVRYKNISKENSFQNKGKSLYKVALNLLLKTLEKEMTLEELVEYLDIKKVQLNIWLKQAIKEKRIKKIKLQKLKSEYYQRIEKKEEQILLK